MQLRLVAVLVNMGLVLASCGGGGETSEPHRDSGATAGTTGFGEHVARLQKRAEDMHVADGAPGILISLRDGSDQTVLAIGDASRHPERKLVPEDTVMIASVTKALVATAAMSLVEDGSIGLGDSVEKWLPGLLSKGRQITVTHLLSMSSGLPNYEDSPDFPGPGVLPPKKLVALVANQPLLFEPGSQGEQSNSNYAVLQLILERAGHARLDELLARRVLKPAGLTHTALGGTPTALGYADDQDVTVRDPAYPSAAAGVVSSVGDIARFLGVLTAGKILDREQTEAMETVHSNVEGDGYGLGLLVRHVSCGTAYGQVGENDGYAIQAWTVPDKDRTGVVAITSGAGGVDAEALEDAALCD